MADPPLSPLWVGWRFPNISSSAGDLNVGVIDFAGSAVDGGLAHRHARDDGCRPRALSKALSLADASLVTPMDFLRVLLPALLGFWLYREGLDIYAILRAMLILAANSLNLIKARDPT